MKNFFSNLFLYFLIGVFILGFVIFYVGLGISRTVRTESDFNGIFVIIGLTVMFPFVVYLIKVLYFDQRKESRKQKSSSSELKRNWVKLTVNLEALEINKSRKSYYSKVINNTARSGALNQMAGNPDRNIRTTEYNGNEIKFKVPYGNNFIKFTKIIDMEPSNLLLHFAVKKETNLYVNPKNINDYYLDLEFLNT